MSSAPLDLSPERLAELALDCERPWHYPADAELAYPHRPQRELPLFVNGHGPFLLRYAPLRLVPIPWCTAYALVRASASPLLTWPPYSPKSEWVVRAASHAYHGY